MLFHGVIRPGHGIVESGTVRRETGLGRTDGSRRHCCICFRLCARGWGRCVIAADILKAAGPSFQISPAGNQLAPGIIADLWKLLLFGPRFQTDDGAGLGLRGRLSGDAVEHPHAEAGAVAQHYGSRYQAGELNFHGEPDGHLGLPVTPVQDGGVVFQKQHPDAPDPGGDPQIPELLRNLPLDTVGTGLFHKPGGNKGGQGPPDTGASCQLGEGPQQVQVEVGQEPGAVHRGQGHGLRAVFQEQLPSEEGAEPVGELLPEPQCGTYNFLPISHNGQDVDMAVAVVGKALIRLHSGDQADELRITGAGGHVLHQGLVQRVGEGDDLGDRGVGAGGDAVFEQFSPYREPVVLRIVGGLDHQIPGQIRQMLHGAVPETQDPVHSAFGQDLHLEFPPAVPDTQEIRSQGGSVDEIHQPFPCEHVQILALKGRQEDPSQGVSGDFLGRGLQGGSPAAVVQHPLEGNETAVPHQAEEEAH